MTVVYTKIRDRYNKGVLPPYGFIIISLNLSISYMDGSHTVQLQILGIKHHYKNVMCSLP